MGDEPTGWCGCSCTVAVEFQVQLRKGVENVAIQNLAYSSLKALKTRGISGSFVLIKVFD